MGYNHTNLTELENGNGEYSLVMLLFKIKRSINILGIADLIAKRQVCMGFGQVLMLVFLLL